MAEVKDPKQAGANPGENADKKEIKDPKQQQPEPNRRSDQSKGAIP